MKSFLSRAAVIGTVALASLAAHAQTYTYQKFSAGAGLFTYALDITDDGHVGGWDTDFATRTSGFIYQGGNLVNVPVSGSNSVQVTAIHGTTLYGTENSLGFSMDGNGKITLLKLPSGASAIPSAVNSKSALVGTYQYQQVQGSFLLQNGTYQTYSVPGADVTSFNAINNQGVIVGTWNKKGALLNSFKLVNGQLSSIAYPGAYSTIATGINDAGEIVGWYYVTAKGPLALFRYDGTTYTNIPTPSNSYACIARHINNAGQFVGSCADSATSQVFSFVATPTGTQQVVLPQQ